MSKAEIKQAAKESVTAFFAENADSDKAISATQLSELVNRDAKTVRARLRKMKVRDQATFKNATWRITQAQAVSELAHYLARDASSQSETQAS